MGEEEGLSVWGAQGGLSVWGCGGVEEGVCGVLGNLGVILVLA